MTEVTPTLTKDASGIAADPNTNYQTVYTGAGASYQRRGFLQYDLSSIPAGATITSATLAMTESVDQGLPIIFKRITDNSWTDAGLTWNNQPATSATNQVNYTTNGSVDNFSVTVTGIVQDAWALGTVVGIAIVENSSTSLVVTWSAYVLTVVYTDGSNIYVDLNKADDSGDGSAWATAKKTINAGYAILTSNGTLHVASGDYSAQTTVTYNKSWKLSPEDPNSTGAKNVKIPKSA